MKINAIPFRKLLWCAAAALSLVGCADDKDSDTNASGLPTFTLQTDWYAQPEHGGFYQAVAKGFYEEEGLHIDIRPGGNSTAYIQMIATGQVDFAVGATEQLLMRRNDGIPLVSLFPYFQHDPQCVLFHPESGIKTIDDLNGREIMFEPGSTYIDYLVKAKGFKFQQLPMTWSLAQFAIDKQFVQQCFLTSEPIYLRQQGIYPETLPMSDSGFDPYRHTYTSEAFVKKHPEVVAAFIRASIKGWQDFMTNDPAPAFALIKAHNPEQTDTLMALIHAEMKHHNLTDGNTEAGETLGQYDLARLRNVTQQMQSIGLLDTDFDLEASFVFDLMPKELVVDSAR